MKKKHKKNILHIGCGMTKKEGAIGVDNNPRTKADVIHDLDVFPYPFKDNQFDTVIAEHILEHLDNIPTVMEELFRITKNGAKIYITSSHFTSLDSFTDPTHKHFLTTRTFDYFIPNTPLYKFQYSHATFKKIKVLLGYKSNNVFLKIIFYLINKYSILYEKRFAFLFPVGTIYYELEVVKK